MNYRREMKQKFIEDFFSVKTWAVFLGTVLLVKGYLTGTHWVSVITTTLSLREVASYRYESNSTTVQSSSGPKAD